MSLNNRDLPVVVVGGGAIGAACAHFLADSGRRVILLEKDRFGEACSAHNCGYVCPSHVLPLTEPGAVRAALLGMLRSNSPFSVKLRPDLRLAYWFLRFSLRCNHGDMIEGARAIQPLLNESMALYRDLVSKKRLACEWKEQGLLYVYRSKEKFEAYAETERLLRESFDESASRLESEELVELEPALKPGLAGAWHYEGDAHLRSDVLMSAWKESLVGRGVQILEGCSFHQVEEPADGVVRVDCSDGPIEASHLVVATGALTPRLAKSIGWRAPIQPGKGYSLTMPRPAVCPEIPMIFPETRVAVTPFEAGYRLGSTMEFAGYDESLDPNRLNLLREGAEAYLLEPFCEPVETTWFGWRPMTWDSVPIIGPCPGRNRVILAAGHNMLGLSMAPSTGKLVSELIEGKQPHLDPRPYSPERF